MVNSSGPIFTLSRLEAAAGTVIYERGERIIHAVRDVLRNESSIHGTVKGTQSYTVSLKWDGQEIIGHCNCPYAVSAAVCKHMVALGIVALKGTEKQPDDPVPAYLDSLDVQQLRDLVLFIAGRSEESSRALLNRAELAAGKIQTIVDEYMAQAKSLLGGRRFVGYYEAMDLATAAMAYLDEVESLLNQGYADEVAPVFLWVATRMRKRLMTDIDDSAGMTGDVCQRAIELYARACREGNPDPIKLGKWLAKFRLDSPGWPDISLQDFAPALGKQGVDAFRKLVNAAIPKEERGYGGQIIVLDFELRAMKLELADYDQDVDLAVHYLSEGGRLQYAAIIQRLLKAARREEAIAYLDQAVADSSISPRRMLGIYPQDSTFDVDAGWAADLYIEEGRGDDALAVVRSIFRRFTGTHTFDLVIDTAQRVGDPEQERKELLEWVENQNWVRGDQAIDIFLHVGEVQRAWEIYEKWGAVSVWETLASARAKDRPKDAIVIYQDQVDILLEGQTGRSVSNQALRLIKAALKIAQEADKNSGNTDAPHRAMIDRWVAGLRDTYARRPTLIQALDKAKI